MPKMDGYMATREIRTLKNNKKANIPIIAMTANAFEEYMLFDVFYETGIKTLIRFTSYSSVTEIRSCFIYQLSHRMTTCFFAANSGITCRTIEAASFSFDSFFCHIRYPRGTDR